jgi:AraC family transcriptional regulator of adaptative response / DNA-3-methyladenine glycosylase II
MLLFMDLSDKNLLFRITRSRDKRYDGRFYCGVKTTGIYCRPICPAKPKKENISFYKSSTEAENAGFRACLRCRPDLAPGSALWGGTAAVVGRALTMIARGEADEISLEQFAAKLGLSDRHLRRLFEEHLGASPTDVATSKRLHLARQLLAQSNLPITDVVFTSGYQSVRRFNEAFKEKFRASPSSVRRSKNMELFKGSNFIQIELPVISPYDWGHIFVFLKSHVTYGIESFSDQKYRRTLALGQSVGAVEIGYDSKKSQLTASISISDPLHLREVIERIRDLFDTRLNPHSQTSMIMHYKKELGIRIPGAWEPFETAVCIILGQLVSVEQARFKIKKLIDQYGTAITNPIFEGCTKIFPNAKVLAEASLKNIGITKVREQAIKELSKQVFEGRIDLSRTANVQKTKDQLLEIKGIGAWTVEMIAMRCLGDPNAFPKTDLIVKRALEHNKILEGDWSPWNAYVTLALWKNHAKDLSKKRMQN